MHQSLEVLQFVAVFKVSNLLLINDLVRDLELHFRFLKPV